MPEAKAPLVMEIDKPHFIVRLFTNVLKVDLKGGAKNEIEEALENKPVLRETLGAILSIFVPLHIRLSDINSVNADQKGRVKIVLPHRRDVTIPLNPDEANKLVAKLNELIPEEKRREVLRIMREGRIEKAAEEHVEAGRAMADYPVQFQSELEQPEVVEDLGEAEELEEHKKED
jgi:hypothetical protein